MRLNVLPNSAEDKPWYSDGLQFTCTQCGNCCTGGPGFVWISAQEIDRLAAHLGIQRQEVIDRYCRRMGDRYSLLERLTPQGQHDCIFLREEEFRPPDDGDGQRVVHRKRVCSIYPVRPLQCRTFPFWDGVLANGRAWRRAAVRCPGMDSGRSYSQQEIERLRTATDWP